MSEVRIELRHTKRVMNQSQDETWAMRLEPRQDMNAYRLSQVNMSRDVSRRDTCIESRDSITAHKHCRSEFASRMGAVLHLDVILISKC